MRQLKLFRWAAALTLAIALAPGDASAQEDDTVTISGVFNMDYGSDQLDLYYFDPDLLAAYNNGYEHNWTLTLHGTTQSHYSTEIDYVELVQDTWIDATSFDLEFFGPDAATLNSIVSEYLAGGDIWIFLRNHYMYYSDDDFALMTVVVENFGVYFQTSSAYFSTLFPTDAEGYPVVEPEPFSIESDSTELGYFDLFSGWGVAIGSLGGPVTFAGNVGEPDPEEPVLLAIEDASVLEGNRGTTWLNLTVSLSRYPDDVVTVDYQTADGTARKKSDYTATSGTLLFWPDEISRTISIAIKGDRKREADETIVVRLSNGVGATIADGTTTATILNDD